MSFSDEALTRDPFLGGRITLLQPRHGYRAATDPVFLAAFVPARRGERVLELGCGAGAALLCLGARVRGLDLHGLEVQPAYSELARRNAALNGSDLQVHDGDLRRMPEALRQLTFDHLLMNPPFHPPGATLSPDPGRAIANGETAPLSDWIDAGLRRLRPGGMITVIHRAERLAAILAALEGRAGGAEVLPLAPRAGRTASRILVRATKGSKSPLILLPPFTVHSGDYHIVDREAYSEAARAVLRDSHPMLPDTR